MKAKNKHNGIKVEYWVVNHESSPPDWIKRLFHIGVLQWREKSLIYGYLGTHTTPSVRLSLGDVLVYDGKKSVDRTGLEYMSNKRFYKKYEVIDLLD